MAENSDHIFSKCHMIEDDHLLFLLCVAGVYVPPGAGIGPGTVFFPGIRPDLELQNPLEHPLEHHLLTGYVLDNDCGVV